MSEENQEVLEDEDADIVTLLDENNQEVDFYHIATIDYKDDWFIFLQPVELLDGMEEDEMFIFKLGQDEEGNDTILPVEDEETLGAVYEEYLKEAENEGCDDCDCGCEEHSHDCECGCKKD